MDPIAIEKTYVPLADPPKGSANQRLPDAFADAHLRYLGRCRSTLGHVETRKPLVETALQKIPEPRMMLERAGDQIVFLVQRNELERRPAVHCDDYRLSR